jgi:AraC-like DNA-binding protein
VYRNANITVGPFLMVDEEDFVQCELESRASDSERLMQAEQELRTIPWISPEQAEPIARQLFLSVGGLGKAFSIGDLLTRQNTDRLMGDLSGFAESEKLADDPACEYPILMEHDFLEAIIASDRSKAETLLNDLLGHIFFLTGGDFSRIRARILELLVLSSRAAIDAGADEPQILALCEQCVGQMGDIYDVDKLCYWLTAVLKRFFDCLFDHEAIEGQNSMPRVLTYMRRNCTQRVTLEDVAEKAHLSPSYFSRVFHAQTGRTFSDYLARLRIDHAKRLLVQSALDMAQIAAQSGFYDQSHFTRTFKNVTGLTPGAYRRRRERGFDELKDT